MTKTKQKFRPLAARGQVCLRNICLTLFLAVSILQSALKGLSPLIFADFTLSLVHGGNSHFHSDISPIFVFLPAGGFFAGGHWADCCWQLEPELPSPLLELPPTEAEAKRAQMGRGEEKGREDGAPVRHMREAMTNTETNTNTRQSKDKYKRSQIRRRAGEDATPVRRHMRPRERRALAGPANSLP